ncbi:MAG: YtxH domain-containing protein [Bacteroidota bacterium]
MKTTNVILGMAAAAMVGAAIGMLLAPEKGSALQKKIKDEANKWIDEVKKLAASAQDTGDVAEDEVKKIKSNLKPIVED